MDFFAYFLADPMNNAKHDPSIRIPKPGDKIRINEDFLNSTRHAFSSPDLLKIARASYQIVDEVSPIVTGKDGDYRYEYSCTLVGLKCMVFSWTFTFVE